MSEDVEKRIFDATLIAVAETLSCTGHYHRDHQGNYELCSRAATRAAIAAYRAALEAEGYVVVPKEPTEAMFDAGLREMQYGIFAAYRAMIAAGKVET